jgi:REP element-mobilizing transposase RayT
MTKREFNEDHTPVGYLITFRAYGTWLHGDNRGSVDRNHRRYGTPVLPPSPRRKQLERRLLKQPPVRFDRRRRAEIDLAIRETCTIRRWKLWAVSVRTNHVHTVVTEPCDPQTVLSALKSNATRSMRETGCWRSDLRPWAHRGSKKYLWTEEELASAIAYVVEEQGESLK